MIDQPASPPPPETSSVTAQADAAQPTAIAQRPDGTLVIDLLQLAPPPRSSVCQPDEPDPFYAEIVVCHTNEVSQRLGPQIGPTDDGFASAIPRARLKLSEKAAAEANATAPSVGGWNAQGGEVRLKIDF